MEALAVLHRTRGAAKPSRAAFVRSVLISTLAGRSPMLEKGNVASMPALPKAEGEPHQEDADGEHLMPGPLPSGAESERAGSEELQAEQRRGSATLRADRRDEPREA